VRVKKEAKMDLSYRFLMKTISKTLTTVFADLMFKYKGFSVMTEYADKAATDNVPVVMESNSIAGIYYTGIGISMQAGYMFENNYEIAARYTRDIP